MTDRQTRLTALGAILIVAAIVAATFLIGGDTGDPPATSTTSTWAQMFLDDVDEGVIADEPETEVLDSQVTVTTIDAQALGEYLEAVEFHATSTTAPPATSPPHTHPPAPAPRAAQGVSTSPYEWPWSSLVICEASGNWAINNGNGYSGGLQFLHSTWVGAGGLEFAPMAWQASPEAQVAVALRIVASQGGTFQAWPGCRAKLGLP